MQTNARKSFIKARQFIRPSVLESYHRTSSRALIARRNLCARVPRATTRSRRFISVRARFAHNSLMWRRLFFSDFLTLARDRALQIQARYVPTRPFRDPPGRVRVRKIPCNVWEALCEPKCARSGIFVIFYQ